MNNGDDIGRESEMSIGEPRQSKEPAHTTTRRNFIKTSAAVTAGAALTGANFSWFTGPTLAQRANANKWKQFSGAKLNFISENTPPSSAAAANMGAFTALTSIDVKITQTQLGNVVEKVALDFGAGTASYQLIYADPYQIMAPYYKGLADLTKFVNDPTFPAVPGPGGIKDFIPSQLVGASYFLDRQHLYTFPYDCPTMIWIYRKDIIAKYKSAFMKAKGFDWTPGPHLTWEQYYTMADWMNKNVHEVKYGTGHQAKQYDSLMCDFSNVLYAYGGQYFPGEPDPVGSVGVLKPGKCQLTSSAGLKAAAFYQKLLKIAHPSSTSWDWSGVAETFAAGEIAMMPEWHEFASTLESPSTSKVAGKVGYAALPRGPKRSCNLWGGTGIGINANASKDEQGAAYLFVLWVTSPDTEVLVAGSKVGGETPVRTSVYNRPDIKAAEAKFSPKYPNLVSMQGALIAWKPENIGFRPKVSTWLKLDTVIFTELSKMLAGQQSATAAMQSAAKQFDAVNGV
jgi:multiple sugar transport system substrate-binding protein